MFYQAYHEVSHIKKFETVSQMKLLSVSACQLVSRIHSNSHLLLIQRFQTPKLSTKWFSNISATWAI